MLPDEPTEEERQEQLPQDNDTPFQQADPNPDPGSGFTNGPVTQAGADSVLDDTHPVTDTNVQPEEAYDEGLSGAAEAQEPNASNAVADFNPPAQLAPDGDTAAAGNDATPPPDDDQITIG